MVAGERPDVYLEVQKLPIIVRRYHAQGKSRNGVSILNDTPDIDDKHSNMAPVISYSRFNDVYFIQRYQHGRVKCNRQ